MVDPFAGSCVTGEVAERLERRWLCAELIEEYLEGALGRFKREMTVRCEADPDDATNYYRVPRPGILWNGAHGAPLPADGGAKRQLNGRRKGNTAKTARKKKLGEGQAGRGAAADS